MKLCVRKAVRNIAVSVGVLVAGVTAAVVRVRGWN